jgi:aminoglycoside phosphotransferase (APT) family kinase protein
VDDGREAHTEGWARVLPSGPLSQVYALAGPTESVVVKLTQPDVAAREAAALRDPPGDAVVPEVLAEGTGVLVLSLLPGEHVRPRDLGEGELRTLAHTLRRVHESRRTGWGQWPQWDAPERTLAGYHAQVAATVRAMAGAEHGARVERVLRTLPELPSAGPQPFRRLHGDLWSANVLWHDGRPALLDWEYSRQGDPAEELAYLAAMDGLPEAQASVLLDAYGDTEVAARVAAWRPLVALSAALWYAELGLDERARELMLQAERP